MLKANKLPPHIRQNKASDASESNAQKYLRRKFGDFPVQWLPLGEVCERFRGTAITANTMKSIANEKGDITIFAGGKTIVKAREEDIPNANVLRIPAIVVQSRGVIDFIFCDTPFTFKNEMWAYSCNNKTTLKYIYYLLKKDVDFFRNKATSMGAFPQISIPDTHRFLIPIPPMEVQNEVVEILDKFSRLTSELQKELKAELKARKLQYEYYRDQLLSFGTDDPTVQWLPLGEVAEYPKDRIEASNLSEDNYISVDNLLKDKQGKKRSEFVPSEGRFINYKIGDILVGNIRPYLKKIWLANNNGGTNGDVLVYRINYNYEKKLSPKYLYYILSSDDFFYYSVKYSKGAKMPRGDKYMNLNYVIPIPPMDEQERIVGILDKFDTLTNSLTEGIPKEIEMRQMQYEYYRDALLSFCASAD